jgi:hypothetical protein
MDGLDLQGPITEGREAGKLSCRSYAGSGPRVGEVCLAVSCEAVLARADYALDRTGSSPTARKLKRGRGEVVVVVRRGGGTCCPWRHGGGGCPSPRRSRRSRPWRVGMGAASGTCAEGDRLTQLDPGAGWMRLTTLEPGSPGWRYMAEAHRLPSGSLRAVARLGLLIERVRGTVCALHTGASGSPLRRVMPGPAYKATPRTARRASPCCLPFATLLRIAVTEPFIGASGSTWSWGGL